MNERRCLSRWVLVAAISAGCILACSDDDDDAPNATAGKGGSGGKAGGGAGGEAGGGGKAGGGESGANPQAGEAGSPSCDSNTCPEVDACGPLPLAALCDARPQRCLSQDELEVEVARYCSTLEDVTVTTQDTTCGGEVVVAEFGTNTSAWGFDEDGALTYVREDNDVQEVCPDGEGQSVSTVWGEPPCAPAGAVRTVCASAPPNTCRREVCDRSDGRFVDCPENLENLNATCGGGVIYERYDSSCGGAIVQAEDGIQTARFTFDYQGALVGQTWAGDEGDSTCWGKPCDLVGPPERIEACAGGAGGAGGAN